MLQIFAYHTVENFTDQKSISRIVSWVRCVMAFKSGFTYWNAKIAFLRASVVFTYYIKLLRTWIDRHNGILMSLLLLVAETIIDKFKNAMTIDKVNLTGRFPNFYQNFKKKWFFKFWPPPSLVSKFYLDFKFVIYFLLVC